MVPPHTTRSRNEWINSYILPFFASLLISSFILLSPDALLAQGAKPNAASLTQDFVVQSSRYQQASPSEQANLLNELIRTAASRQQLLLSIMEQNLGKVLRVAFPASIRASLPAATQALVEENVPLEGTLEVM